MSTTRSRSDRHPGSVTAVEDSRRYLLFAGTRQPPKGGLSDLVDTFTSEEAARRAFRELRLRTVSTTSWAQLAVVDGHAGIRPLCWFGIGAEPGRGGPADTSAGRVHAPRRFSVAPAILRLLGGQKASR